MSEKPISLLPIRAWNDNLDRAVADIQQAAEQLLLCDTGQDPRASEIYRNWRLKERRQEERLALESIRSAVGGILLSLDQAISNPSGEAFEHAAGAIDNGLASLESGFVNVRHCAQDLLHWAGRFTGPAGDKAAGEYRVAYGDLIRFTPVIRPRIEAFRDDLAQRALHDGEATAEKRLLASLNRYLGVMEPAYGFIQAVAEPPLDLVFEETGPYLESFRGIELSTRRKIASAINDCCQNLLYQPLVFDQLVRAASNELPGDADSSVVVFDTEGHSVVMAVDEDPIFGELTIRLLGVAKQDEVERVIAAANEQLKMEWQ